MAKITVDKLYNDYLSKLIRGNKFKSIRITELRRVTLELMSRENPDLSVANNVFSHHVEMSLCCRKIKYILQIERGERILKGVGYANAAVESFVETFLGGNIKEKTTQDFLSELYSRLIEANFGEINITDIYSKYDVPIPIYLQNLRNGGPENLN